MHRHTRKYLKRRMAMEDMITRAKKKYTYYLQGLKAAERRKKELKGLLKDKSIPEWTKPNIKKDLEYKEEDCCIAYGRTQAAEAMLVEILGVPMAEIKNIQEEVRRRQQ